MGDGSTLDFASLRMGGGLSSAPAVSLSFIHPGRKVTAIPKISNHKFFIKQHLQPGMIAPNKGLRRRNFAPPTQFIQLNRQPIFST